MNYKERINKICSNGHFNEIASMFGKQIKDMDKEELELSVQYLGNRVSILESTVGRLKREKFEISLNG